MTKPSQLTRTAPFSIVLLLLVTSCGTPTEPLSSIREGWWTSDTGWAVRVDSGSATIFASCGHGTFPRVVPRDDGSFETEGTLLFSFGPPSSGPDLIEAPALYAGVSSETRLTLTISRPGGMGFGPFSFMFDGPKPKRFVYSGATCP